METTAEFRKNQHHHTPLLISNTAVEVTSSTKFPVADHRQFVMVPQHHHSCNESTEAPILSAVQRAVTKAGKIIGTLLPSFQDIAKKRCLTRAKNLTKDPTHPHHGLFSLLPSGSRFRSIRCRTARFSKQFPPPNHQRSGPNNKTPHHHM